MKSKLLFVLLTVMTVSSSFQDKSTGILTFNVAGLHSNKGEVEAFLFKSKDGFPDNPKNVFKKVRAKIINGTCTLVFENLPDGEYAGGAFHDENNNGKLDENFISFPTEGIGITNMPSIGIFNQPKYSNAKFQFSNSKEITIKINYL